MKIKLFTLLLLTALVLSLFAGCKTENGPLTEEKAYAIVYEHAGVKEADAEDPHLHVLADNGEVTYNIHFTANGIEYDYTIHSKTGEILTHKP